MTADFTNDRRRRRLVILVGLILAVVAAAGAYYLLSRSSANQPPAATRPVVVASVAIPARSVIAANQVTTRTVPDSPVWNSIARSPNEVVGKVAVVSIAVGVPIATNVLGTGGAAGVPILTPDETIGPDSPIWRAVSISVGKDRAVGGKLSAGDHIDLYVTLSPQIFDPNGPIPGGFSDPSRPLATTNGYYSDQTTKVVWTNLEILQVDDDGGLYVLKVDQAQAEQIAHVQSIGASFTIGLRPPGDDRSFDPTTYGQTTNNLIELFGFKIPEVIVVSTPGPQPSASPSASPGPTEVPSPTP